MLLEQAVKEYLVEIVIKGYSKETVKAQKANLNQFIKFKGNVDIESVTTMDIKEFIMFEQKRIKANTLNQYLMNLKTFFKYMVDEEVIKQDPMEKISKVKEGKNVIKTYSEADVLDLIDYFNGKDFLSIRNKTIVTLLVETGIRNSELCNLRLSDVFEDSIRIQGKGDKVRYVPISLPLKRQLMKYMRSREKHCLGYTVDNLFVNRSRKPVDRYRIIQLIQKAGEDIGLATKATVHHFRRFYAQQMLRNTDLYTVSRLLGHSDIKTTQLYIQGIEDKEILSRGMHSPLTR